MPFHLGKGESLSEIGHTCLVNAVHFKFSKTPETECDSRSSVAAKLSLLNETVSVIKSQPLYQMPYLW